MAGKGVKVTGDDGTDVDRATQLAADSDVAVVVPVSYSTEGVDRTCLTFECPPVYGDQDALIEAVTKANPKTAVVMESGGPVLTPWDKQAGAVLEAWYPGSEAGSAMARVLFGKVDASGRLPVTFPESEDDLPTAGNPSAYPGVNDVVEYTEGLLVGYRHYDANGIKPAYPSATASRTRSSASRTCGSSSAKRGGRRSASRSRTPASAAASRSRSSTCRCPRRRPSPSRRRR